MKEGRKSKGGTVRAAKVSNPNALPVPEWTCKYGLILTVIRSNRQWPHTIQLNHAPFGILLNGHKVLEINPKSRAYGSGLRPGTSSSRLRRKTCATPI